ncbi:MAG: TetR/AcrR family transcriptional regulator [Frankiaceae bacterium]|nr:TetR/AcrR family transcriptional regulator [Frankiaceae bacterium]
MSELPVLTGPGTRVRAGNAMGRTRTALLEAALTAIEKHGARKATMGDVSRIANVAKGTLYNHFRSKDDLYDAAARAAVAELGQRAATVAASRGLGAGLAVAAAAIAGSPVLARLRSDEPAVFGAALAAAAGDETRSAVGAVLAAGGAGADAGAVEITLRWLLGYAAGSVDVAALPTVADRLATSLAATHTVVVNVPSSDLGPDALTAPAGASMSAVNA